MTALLAVTDELIAEWVAAVEDRLRVLDLPGLLAMSNLATALTQSRQAGDTLASLVVSQRAELARLRQFEDAIQSAVLEHERAEFAPSPRRLVIVDEPPRGA